MAASVPLFATFAIYERFSRSPLIDMSLFRNRSVVAGLLVTLAFFVANGFSFVMTLHLQDGLGFSPMRTGLSFLPFSLGVVFGGGASTQLVPRLGRRIVIMGALVMSVGVLLLLFAVQRYGLHLNPWQLAPGYLIAGFGMSMVATTLITIVLSDIPPAHAGSASGLITTAMQVGMSVSIAAVGAVFFNRLDHGAGYVHATRTSLWFVAGLFLLSFVFGFLLPRRRPTVEPEVELAASGESVGHGYS
jgi:MFS family permease